MKQATEEQRILDFKTQRSWETWLNKNFGRSPGLWIRFFRKATGVKSVSYEEALEVALCHGWIDGLRKKETDQTYLQKFTPRAKRSTWSKINRDKALKLIDEGRMKAGGLAEIERAKQDGRWEAAYDSYRTATVPDELQTALNRNPEAKAFFETLDSRNRYAILFRIQTATKTETKASRIKQYVEMLARREKLHPQL